MFNENTPRYLFIASILLILFLWLISGSAATHQTFLINDLIVRCTTTEGAPEPDCRVVRKITKDEITKNLWVPKKTQDDSRKGWLTIHDD